MKERVKKLHEEFRKIKKKRDRLSKKVQHLIDTQGMKLNQADHNDLKCLVLNAENQMDKQKLTQFQKLFWEQQAEAAKKRLPWDAMAPTYDSMVYIHTTSVSKGL